MFLLISLCGLAKRYAILVLPTLASPASMTVWDGSYLCRAHRMYRSLYRFKVKYAILTHLNTRHHPIMPITATHLRDLARTSLIGSNNSRISYQSNWTNSFMAHALISPISCSFIRTITTATKPSSKLPLHLPFALVTGSGGYWPFLTPVPILMMCLRWEDWVIEWWDNQK